MRRYGEWTGWNKNKLTEKAKKELEGKRKIKSSPSTLARSQARGRPAESNRLKEGCASSSTSTSGVFFVKKLSDTGIDAVH